jgi:hypothetical protein
LYGAKSGGSRDADLLAAAGAARPAQGMDDLSAAVAAWLSDHEARRAAGAAAESVIKNGLGAAEASYDLLVRLLDRNGQ